MELIYLVYLVYWCPNVHMTKHVRKKTHVIMMCQLVSQLGVNDYFQTTFIHVWSVIHGINIISINDICLHQYAPPLILVWTFWILSLKRPMFGITIADLMQSCTMSFLQDEQSEYAKSPCSQCVFEIEMELPLAWACPVFGGKTLSTWNPRWKQFSKMLVHPYHCRACASECIMGLFVGETNFGRNQKSCGSLHPKYM